MRTIGLLIVTTVLAMFSSILQAEEAYHVVNVWPEAPQGWHFYQLFGIAVDKSDNVYVGDSGNYKIKKFDSEGRFITQWGSPGQGDGQFSEIHGVRVGSSGTVYVVDEDHQDGQTDTSRIQKFTPYGQFIGLFERTAPGADKVELSIDVTEDDRGNIFILAVDYAKRENLVRRAAVEKYSPDGEFIAQWGMDAGGGDGQLQIPTAIDVDGKGDFYIVEYANNRVQKFDPSGNFLMKWETQGEGESRFSGPYSIALDKSEDVYVRDRNGVHKFTPTGEFLASWEMKADPRGVALDSQSNVYITNRKSNSVLKLDRTGKTVSEWGSGASTTGGRFGSAGTGSIAVAPSGHIVVADAGNCRIQRFTSAGQFLSTLGAHFWFELDALAADTSGNLYVVCGGSNEIEKFDPDGKLICRWGGTGDGDDQFQDPSAIALDPAGNVYVADWTNNRVQKFTGEGRFLAKWGTEGTGAGQFKKPFFIAVDDSGNVWVGDQHDDGEHRMQKFDASGKFLASWTKKVIAALPGAVYDKGVAVDRFGNSYYAFDGRIEKYDAKGDFIGNYAQEALTKAKPGAIKGIVVDRTGCLYFTDALGKVMRFDIDGHLANTWTAEGMEEYGTRNARPITVDGTGSVYISYYIGQWIYRFSSEGKPLAKFRIAPPVRRDGFTELGGVTVDSSGNIYAVDSVDLDWEWGLPAIQTLDANGQFIATWDLLKTAAGKIKYPAFIAVDGSGYAYVTDKSSHSVHKLDARGAYLKSWGSKGTGDGQFDTPEGIAADGSGHVYVCDRQNSRIQEFDSDGNFLAKWGKEGSGDGEFHFPAAVAVDKEGNVFVADSDNHRVQKFTADGTFVTTWGQFGEAPGQFNVPLGIAVDKEGNVYVSDSHNHRIQKFAPAASR